MLVSQPSAASPLQSRYPAEQSPITHVPAGLQSALAFAYPHGLQSVLAQPKDGKLVETQLPLQLFSPAAQGPPPLPPPSLAAPPRPASCWPPPAPSDAAIARSLPSAQP